MASRITSCGSSLSPLKVLLEGSRDEIRLTDTRLKMGFLIAPFRYPSTQRLEMYRAFRHLSSDLKSWHHRSPLYNPPVCSAGDAHKSHGSEGRLDEYVDTLGRRGRDVDRLRILLSRPRRGLRQYPVLARGLLRRTGRRTKSGWSSAYDPQFLGATALAVLVSLTGISHQGRWILATGARSLSVKQALQGP